MNETTLQYFLQDYPRTLFPLATTHILIQNHAEAILKYIYEKVLNKLEPEYSFLPQLHCYASKTGFHLRRTVKLDPVSELFIYDLVYRNRKKFRSDFRENRKSFGYRFEGGQPIAQTHSYAEFKSFIAEGKKSYQFSAKFDISSYFNSIYHHDLIGWFSEGGRSLEDTEYFGQFLREINAGRSVDCLPQGLHPCKVIGAEFLKFVDNSILIKSQLMLRFMDDYYLFDNDESVINSDFVVIQKMLGEKGLFLNSAKTRIGQVEEINIEKQVDTIKAGLLQVRRHIIEVSGIEFDQDEEEEYEELSDEQIEYLLDILKDPDIHEEDAELVLILLRDHGSDVLERMKIFLERFPSLSKTVYTYCRYLNDKTELSNLVKEFLKTSRNITENQLFWLAKMTEDYLMESHNYGNIIELLYNHPHATSLTQAKVLEIPDNRFGLPELRSEHLRVGKSDWLSWSAAVGCRQETKISRNHYLGYFSKASPMNKLISDCISAL
ncbi:MULTISPECIES: antiviral reverse transcriptase Drt5 [unclassified Microcoleus]|uniref:antiviral reverse transcriptase Drt5 n=1 Tax=unclassified Microcoleus TaxID=2642155 RepID=UPI002FD232B5